MAPPCLGIPRMPSLGKGELKMQIGWPIRSRCVAFPRESRKIEMRERFSLHVLLVGQCVEQLRKEACFELSIGALEQRTIHGAPGI